MEQKPTLVNLAQRCVIKNTIAKGQAKHRSRGQKGEHVRFRSVSVFVESYKLAYSIRFSLKNFGEAGV